MNKIMFKSMLVLCAICAAAACRPVESKKSTLSTQKDLPCDLQLKVKTLTNPSNLTPENENQLYQLARQENLTPDQVAKGIDRWPPEVFSSECRPPSCSFALIKKEMKRLVRSLPYALYAGTLKLREIDGKARVMVKGTGSLPVEDSRQFGVYQRQENSYFWKFRKAAGDLHPAFVFAEILGEEPYSLAPNTMKIRLEQNTNSKQDWRYKAILGLFFELERRGFITYLKRNPDDPIKDLYLVNPAKDLSREVDLWEAFDAKFKEKKSVAQAIREATLRLFAERKAPILRPNQKGKFEITADVLKAMGKDLPLVAIYGGSVNSCDHHRIQGAYDLGMAIEVMAYRGYLTLN